MFDDEGVSQEDVLELTGVTGVVRYRLPGALEQVEVELEGGTLGSRGPTVTARATGGSFRLIIRGRWKA